jgi:hypothetical protein
MEREIVWAHAAEMIWTLPLRTFTGILLRMPRLSCTEL